MSTPTEIAVETNFDEQHGSKLISVYLATTVNTFWSPLKGKTQPEKPASLMT